MLKVGFTTAATSTVDDILDHPRSASECYTDSLFLNYLLYILYNSVAFKY